MLPTRIYVTKPILNVAHDLAETIGY